MSALIDVGAADAVAKKSVARVPEVCPICGVMALYVDPLPCGRLLAAHDAEDRIVVGKVSDAKLRLKNSRFCHGYKHSSGRIVKE